MSIHRPRNAASRAGFSLIELLISVGMLALILGSAGIVSVASNDAFKSTAMTTDIQSRAQRNVDKVAAQLARSATNRIFPDPSPLPVDDLSFQTATGLTGSNVDWSPVMQLAFQYEAGELDDGLDNNGNGLVDEGVLVFTRDVGGANQNTTILCRGVAELLEGELPNNADDNGNGLVDEPGFCVLRNGELLTIRVTIERASSDGAHQQSTFETSVKLRN